MINTEQMNKTGRRFIFKLNCCKVACRLTAYYFLTLSCAVYYEVTMYR